MFSQWSGPELSKVKTLLSGPIAKSSMLSVGIKMASLLISFGQAILTARLLGVDGYGVVAFALAMVNILATISVLGFGPMAVREIPAMKASSGDKKVRSFLTLSFGLTMICALLIGAGLAIAAETTSLFPPESRDAMALAGALLVPHAILFLFNGWARGFSEIALAQVPNELLRSAMMLILLVAIFLLGQSLQPTQYLSMAIVIAGIATMIAAVWLWKARLRGLPRSEVAISRMATLGSAMPFLGIGLVALLQAEINTLLLSWLSGPREAGLFQPVARFMPLMTLGVTAAGMAFAPKVTELWQRGEMRQVEDLTAKFTLTTTAITAIAGLCIAGAGPWLMLVFGQDFVQSAPLLWYVAAAQVFNAACGPVGMLLAAANKATIVFRSLLFGLASNLALGFALIPDYGAFGAALAMSASAVAWNCALIMGSRNSVPMNPTIIGSIRN